MDQELSATRRGVLRGVGAASLSLVAAACAPSAAPVPSAPAGGVQAPAAPQKPAWEGEWEQLIAAAKKEGKVSVLTLGGVGYRRNLDDFQAAFGITVEHEAAPSGSVWSAKVEAERKGGIYSFDAFIIPPNTAIARYKSQGVWDPIRPLLFRPDVLDNKVWREGFEGHFMDNEKQIAFGWEYTVYHNVAIDTSNVKPDEIKTFQDLLDPKWKGKIVATDVRLGPTYIGMSVVRDKYPNGDELVKRFLVDQQPIFHRESRLLAEAIVRKRNPIAYGLSQATLTAFEEQGVADHVKYLDVPDVDAIYSWSVLAYNKAPHPNATKLFINWLLTKEGQTSICKHLPSNSARTDVDIFNKVGAPTPGVKYYSSGRESTYQRQTDTQKFINDLVGVTN